MTSSPSYTQFEYSPMYADTVQEPVYNKYATNRYDPFIYHTTEKKVSKSRRPSRNRSSLSRLVPGSNLYNYQCFVLQLRQFSTLPILLLNKVQSKFLYICTYNWQPKFPKLLFFAGFKSTVPGVTERKIIATYSGLRPRSKENNDYQIRFNDEKTFATLGAIRSTGLTASRGWPGDGLKILFNRKCKARLFGVLKLA